MGRNDRRYTAAFRLLALLLAIVCLVWFLHSLGSVRSRHGEEGRQQLETALRRAAVACYASEGVYPPTVEYLQDHYGVQIDPQRYIVFYEIFANNLMPDITVLEKEHP